MTTLRLTGSCLRILIGAAVSTSAFAQTPPAVAHPLGPVLASAPGTFGASAQLVPLSDGRVLVSDATKHIVTLFDATLAHPKIVLDSASGRWTSFGAAGGASYLARFLGDSSLFFDGAAKVFVVIQPDGTLGRVVAPPSYTTPFPSTLDFVTSWTQHGILYRVTPSTPAARLQQILGSAVAPPDTTITRDDSITIVRMNFATRTIDSVARIGTGRVLTLALTPDRPFPMVTTPPALFPFVDEVAATSDGFIGVFRAREYRIDWIAPDGTLTRGARLPYPWRRITDDLRQQMVDSINRGRRAAYDTYLAQRAADSVRTGAAPTLAVASIVDGVVSRRQVPVQVAPPPKIVTLDEVPDYFPPVGTGTAAMADADGHIWLGMVSNDAASAGTPCGAVVTERGFSVWDVVSRSGGVIDRVQIPSNGKVVGFGPGGAVYLRYFLGAGQWRLDKVQVAAAPGSAVPNADAAPRRAPSAVVTGAVAGRGGAGRRFVIAPAIDGKTSWDLDADGALDLGTPGTWTITPQGSFVAAAHLWGGGGGGPFSAAGRGGGGGYSTGSISFENNTPYTLVVGGGGQGALKAGCGANGGHGGGGAGGGVQPGGDGNPGLPFADGGHGQQGSGTAAGAAGGGGGLSGLFSGSRATQASALLIAGGGGGATFGAVSGGAGGGIIGEDGGGTLPGRGGTAIAGGALAAPASPSPAAGAGGRGGRAGGGGSGSSANTSGGAGFGGGGPFAAGSGAGGGGGGGYFGGSSGGQNRGGGGGGSGYVAPSVGRGSTVSGRGEEAGNAKDSGNGGAGAGAALEGSPGGPGRIIIR